MAAYLDFEIEAGATFTADLAVTDEAGDPIDLTGYTARMDIKRDAREDAALLSLTTDNAHVIITAPSGQLLVYISAAETSALTFTRGIYDLEIVDALGRVTRLVEGAVIVKPEVTT